MATSTDTTRTEVRSATPADVPVILGLIRELADYEKLTDICVATEQSIHDLLFGAGSVAEALIGEYEGKPVGFALFFYNVSTFLGKRGIYLEDVYVQPAMRGKGLGKALLLHLIRLAHERGCGRVEWSVLNWNTPAIDFYKSLGAEPLDEWTVFRVTGQTLVDLARNGGTD